jgi:putative flippase GtrA
MNLLHYSRSAAEQVAVPAASAVMAWNWPFDQIAIPAVVLFTAFLGASIWVFLDQPNGSRLRVYGTAICYALLSAAGAVIIVHIFGIQQNIAAPIALLIASGGRPLYAAFRQGAAERIRNIAKGDP